MEAPKVLWIYEDWMLCSQKHIIEALRDAGAIVELENVPIGNPAKMQTDEVIQRHRGQHDFHVVTTHGGNPHMRTFHRYVRPKVGIYDLEHDLFQNAPDLSPEKLSLGVFVFTRAHAQSMFNLRGYKALPARWYKLDGDKMDLAERRRLWQQEVGDDLFWHPGSDAIVIGSRLWGDMRFEWGDWFQYAWYKPFHASDVPIPGTRLMPFEFRGAQAVNYLRDISRWWFTYESSCYVEALMYGALPILCNPDIVERERVTEVLERVKVMKKTPSKYLQTALAVTTRDLGQKLRRLTRDHDLFRETVRLLREEYLPDSFDSLPPVHEVLVQEITQTWEAHNNGSRNPSRRAR